MDYRSARTVRIGIVEVFTDGDVTVALMRMSGVVVAGASRREPGDRPDRDIGSDLAVSRALHKMSRRLQRRANGAVKQATNIKAAKTARRARAGADTFVLAEGPPPTARANLSIKPQKAGKGQAAKKENRL